jgi:hypothetical protein
VPRSRIFLCYCAFCAFWSVSGLTWAAETPRLSETLLPDTTQGFFAISNVDDMIAHWNKTQIGHLIADPVMKPFTDDLRRQINARWSTIGERLGITLDDMRELPGGDVGIAVLEPAPGTSAFAVVADVTGKRKVAEDTLKRVTETQRKRGAKRSEVKVEGFPDAVVQFDLPAREGDKNAALQETEGDAKKKTTAAAVAKRQAFYCLTGNLLVVVDNFDVMKEILGHVSGKSKSKSLADHKAFKMVMARCRKDYPGGEKMPQMRWFIHPLGYAEAARAATPPDKRRKGKSVLEVMRNQGVGALQGIGGFVDFSSEGYDLIHRTSIYAPRPFEKAMRMAVLPNKTEFEPEPWAPRKVSTYATFYFDILNAFDNFGTLFDELFGAGEHGVWGDTLKSLKLDPNGPQIDLREELVVHLGQRVSVMTDYQLPIGLNSERLLCAIEVKNPKAVAAAIKKLFKNDPTVKMRDVKGQVIWEFVEDDAPPMESPQIELGDSPTAHVTTVAAEKEKTDKDDEKERKRLLPHAAFTVWHDHLMVASHMDFLMKILDPPKNVTMLKDDVDYKLVDAEIQKFQPERCFRFFSRTDEEYRPTYELIRQNKMPESESLFAKLLNAMFGDGKDGETRHQRIDGSKLPEYQVVRRYLDPAGLQATSESDGWYLKGFTMSKEGE